MEIWRDKNGLYKDADGSIITPEAYLSAYRAKHPKITEYWKKVLLGEIQHKPKQGEIEKCQQSQSE